MKSLTKYQIETAENTLRLALYKKRKEKEESEFKKQVKTNEKKILLFMKNAVKLKEEAHKLNKDLEKNTNIKLDDNSYSSFIHKLPKNIEEGMTEVERNTKKTEKYFKKEEEEIENFILGLKLGTSLMSNIENLIEKINKLK